LTTADRALELRAEARLVLLCARGTFGPSERERALGLMEGGVDWRRLVELAEDHGLAPILYRRLDELDPDGVPRPVFARLWCRYESAARRNRAMTAELQTLLWRFEQEGVTALPFKGPTLALQLYDDIALREFGDLDILVRTDDLMRARDLAEAAGYVPDYPLARRWERKPLANVRHYTLSHRHPERGFKLELHWSTDCRLFALPCSGDRWWDRRPNVGFEGGHVRALTPEELLYVLCMHGARHRWSSLGWLCDLAELIRRHPGLDWRQVLDTAQRQGTSRLLLLGLELARRLLGAPLPGPVLGCAAEVRGLSAMAGSITRRSGLTTAPPPSIAGKLSGKMAWFKFWPPWLGYALGDALLPNMADWSRWDLPPTLAVLHVPLHVVRMLLKHGAMPKKGLQEE
jgi:hypothetical protein